ncbi:hypothetical protein Pcinc_028152 [Petrolisthes cinctipes]|uniref:Uncharacterized protein n=1 Tax=Petrolisthes cinctipes TaxID=88211 RepID=A0AAE1F3M2_PETCI|nr:hypothetical protein Pcinc_028152 [Petrolisthes cinctipes]
MRDLGVVNASEVNSGPQPAAPQIQVTNEKEMMLKMASRSDARPGIFFSPTPSPRRLGKKWRVFADWVRIRGGGREKTEYRALLPEPRERLGDNSFTSARIKVSKFMMPTEPVLRGDWFDHIICFSVHCGGEFYRSGSPPPPQHMHIKVIYRKLSTSVNVVTDVGGGGDSGVLAGVRAGQNYGWARVKCGAMEYSEGQDECDKKCLPREDDVEKGKDIA